MITFFYNLSPNPMKVALCLEEMELPYEGVAVDTRKGEQFAPDYVALNPNGKVPTIVDRDAPGGTATVFDSNAILLYLAEKTGRFAPTGGAAGRAELFSWMMFVASGVSPFSGQAVHFRHFAPEPMPYALARYQYEAERHYGILDERLATRPFMLGDTYSVVDMAVWGWARMVPFIMGDDAWSKFPNLKRSFDTVSARPAAARVEAFRTEKAAAFKSTMDDEARAHMFKFLKAA